MQAKGRLDMERQGMTRKFLCLGHSLGLGVSVVLGLRKQNVRKDNARKENGKERKGNAM
jgi:hypothetical protein